MSMKFKEMTEAVGEAKVTIIRANILTTEIVEFVAERLDLKRADTNDLCTIKRKLAKFNMQTGEWKE